jgi:hypothetical protein
MSAIWEQPIWSKFVDLSYKPFVDDPEKCEFDELRWTLQNAPRFDCRALNQAFVADTGIECLEALKAGAELPQSPFPSVLFQFNNGFVIVSKSGISYFDENEEQQEAMDILEISSFVEPYNHELLYGRPVVELVQTKDWKEYQDTYDSFDEIETPDYSPTTVINGDGDGPIDRRQIDGAILALGALTLLEERLLVKRKVSAPRPVVNAKRAKRGEAPIVSHWALRINLAEARRQTKGVALHHHESPLLHWRRGHWRTLHRGSEFEGRTWVRKCLVGDASKGFAAKHYRLIWQQQVH